MTFGGMWGTGGWGLGPWGGVGSPGGGALTVAGALATTTNTVQVTLSAPPLAVSPIGQGDALNPSTWTITDTAGNTYTVMAVLQDNATQFELQTLEAFQGWLTVHTVASATLTDATGHLVGVPDSAPFAGVQAATMPLTDSGVTNFDLANPQTPATGIAGILRTTPGGDFATEAGAALIEKLIYRAINTQLGGFAHLPDYGFGITIKQNVTPAKLSRLKADLVQLVENIPGVAAADCRISFDNASGIMTVTTTAQLTQTGQQIQVINRTPPPSVKLS
jgi:hypothetical protein